MLTLVVAPWKEQIITVDGNHMTVYPVLVEDSGKFGYLQDHTDFAEIEGVEILAIRWLSRFQFVRWCLHLKLTPEVERGIIKFLNRYHAKQNRQFCCYAFVGLVCGVKGEPHDQVRWLELWSVKAYRWQRVVGDVVFLVSNHKKLFHHAAIYIGRGLYVSVYGAGGDLEIATLEDMKRDFGAKDVVSVTPRT